MEIFIDSANLDEIRRWLEYGVADGVTTNPSIMLKDEGYDMEKRAKEIAALIYPRPVSVEVTTNHHEQMIDEAKGLASWAPNIVVKIPVINEYGEPCLGVVKALVEEGIKINMTACLSFSQVVLGTKARATYVSILRGRDADRLQAYQRDSARVQPTCAEGAAALRLARRVYGAGRAGGGLGGPR